MKETYLQTLKTTEYTTVNITSRMFLRLTRCCPLQLDEEHKNKKQYQKYATEQSAG
jgi:hypothetical protein